MDFALTPEHEELVRTLRQFAKKELAPRSREWDRRNAPAPCGLAKKASFIGVAK